MNTNQRTLHIDVYRNYFREKYIIGKLFMNDKYMCDTFEPPMHGAYPCITDGSYRVTLDVVSPTFKSHFPYKTLCSGKVPRLLDVPNRSGILIHCGNGFAEDGHIQTKGCILVGKNTSVGRVTSSIATFTELYNIMKTYNKVYIHIYNVPLDTTSKKYV